MNTVRSWVERHGYPFAVMCIAAATAIFYPGREYFAKAQWALLYPPVIVLVASSSGIRPAMLASVLSFLAWNFFFLPPYHTFVVADPKDWLSLVVSLLVGIAMGLQTGRMKSRESQAVSGRSPATRAALHTPSPPASPRPSAPLPLPIPHSALGRHGPRWLACPEPVEETSPAPSLLDQSRG